MNHYFSHALFVLLLFSAIIQSCSKEAATVLEESKGRLEIKITDAPIDNDEVIGAFFTISGVSITGDTNFLPYSATVDLLSYQQGRTKDLVSFELPIGTYDNIEIQFDLQQDAYGNTPGCYIATIDGKKHNLEPSTSLFKQVIVPLPDLQITPDKTSTLVIDFDLRKMIKRNPSQNQIPYLLVDDSRLEQSIRVVSENSTGGIKGTFDRGALSANKVLAFAYVSHTFNRSAEIRVTEYSPGFSTAINSAMLDERGSFYLPFLLRGDYELIFVSLDEGGNFTIIEGQSTSSNLLNQIRVEPGNDVIISGVLNDLPPT